MDLMATSLSPFTTALLVPSIVAVVSLLTGWLVGRIQVMRRAQVSAASASHESRDKEVETRDMRKMVYLLQNENTKLSTFLMTLPDLARQLNSNDEKRKIPQILINFIEQLFDAEQVLIFLTTLDGKHLTLTAEKGLPETVRSASIVPFGKGRPGWVAWHQITMDENDFLQKSRVERGELDTETHPLFRTELCAPMVSKGQTIGVISLGGLLRRPKNEKNMLKMVADLGSIAIQNTVLFNQIQESANSDGLTGLSNKRYFMERLAAEVLKAEKEGGQCLSLFIFDIDHFKNYNDTNGHPAGDEALRITGRVLRESIRREDLAARYGGEEFVVLLPNTDKNGATIAAEKLRKIVESFEYPHQDLQPGGNLTISGGVATFPYDAKNMADLIRAADQGLYQGKRSGRNKIGVFEPKYLSEETNDEDRHPVQTQQGM